VDGSSSNEFQWVFRKKNGHPYDTRVTGNFPKKKLNQI
jgi:hypothetical protein